MKIISIWLMKINLATAIKSQRKESCDIVKSAYNNCIKSYRDAIMFLEAEREPNKKRLK